MIDRCDRFISTTCVSPYAPPNAAERALVDCASTTTTFALLVLAWALAMLLSALLITIVVQWWWE